MPYVLALIYWAGLTAHFHGMFQRTHDEWLLLLVLDVMWLGILRLWSPPGSAAVAAGWGVFGGFAAICSPVAGMTWAATTVGRWLPIRRPLGHVSVDATSGIRMLAIAGNCSVFTIMPWTIRNYLVFGKRIPIKSNCVYEIWQSQCLDDDGVVKDRQNNNFSVSVCGWDSCVVPVRKEVIKANRIAFEETV